MEAPVITTTFSETFILLEFIVNPLFFATFAFNFAKKIRKGRRGTHNSQGLVRLRQMSAAMQFQQSLTLVIPTPGSPARNLLPAGSRTADSSRKCHASE
jgi:hypothetical protein